MANKPKPPSYKFKRPFCDEGTKTNIPDVGGTPGRASLADGFPTETQLPLAQGGVAPNRLDFNGVLNALSQGAYWRQSGGQASWEAGLDYDVPCIAYHAGKLWWCLAPNGPGNAAGPIEPGTDEAVWRELLYAIAEQAAGGGGSDVTNVFGGNPVGTVIMYYGTTAPDGYLVCDDSPFSATDYPRLYALLGAARTPDLRGAFVRGLDPAATRDPDGATRALGSYQADAMQNVTGTAVVHSHDASAAATGAFSLGPYNKEGPNAMGDYNNPQLNFDASRVARTSTENRPKNVAMLFCIRHD